MDFTGKTIIITGGASGIGAAMARLFARHGAHVVIADLQIDLAEQAAREIGGAAVKCDVTHEADIQDAVAWAESRFGTVDMFISNAGVAFGEPDHAASASDDVWQRNWDVHVMAHVYAARAVLPGMIARRSGMLVQMASAAGLLNQIGDAAYSATKHAAVSFAESLAITHAEDGIAVSVVCPQYVATPLIGLCDADADTTPSLMTADQVAQSVFDGVSDGAFLILPHPVVSEYVRLKSTDYDRWLCGMRKLRTKARSEFGSTRADDIYKLV